MCDGCRWAETIEQIDDLLEGGQHRYAAETLAGIREWVEQHEHVTERQTEAVANIEAKPERRR